MSDTEILEITDTSIKENNAENNIEESNKRKLSKDDDLDDSLSGKKMCRDTECLDDSSLIVEPIIAKASNIDSEINEENDVLEGAITESKINEGKSNIEIETTTLLEEDVSERKSDGDQTHTVEEASVYESSDEDDYDRALIMRAMNALPKQSCGPKTIADQEPIALDSDSNEEIDDDCTEETDKKYPIEEMEDEEEDSYIYLYKRIMRYNPKFYFARRLIKKSIKILLQRANVKEIKQSSNLEEKVVKENVVQINEKNTNGDDVIEKNEKIYNDEKISDTAKTESVKNIPSENIPFEEVTYNKENMGQSTNTINPDEEKPARNVCSKLDDSNESEINSLMNEISSSTIDEIMSRYVFCNTDKNIKSISIDEFTEQLFYCLQENKKEIESIQRIWNEKVHLKFKMREIMERIRRNRVISEIESFGIKSSQDNQACNLLHSSKSSTTNSENEQYVRSSSNISSHSVNRLIQDVRENVLKKDKYKPDEASGIKFKYDENFDDSSYALSSNIFQQSSNQGRQGQTVDVQSIINDFRQKNPQEIPRRGRRMKSSYLNNLLANQLQTQEKVEGSSNCNNFENNSTMKTSSSHGFPEVSLLPVNSFYKSHSPQYGQKSSLLQSILTKQPNKHPLIMQQNNKSSTLARLLTAPEKSFQSPSRSVLQHSSKVHNNGEITITPIAGTSRRQIIDDEENSEPPLVIDESDDFITERHNTSGPDLLCQGCRRNKALFMCAGCSRQWYCSKECQELAWDDHAESCMV